MSQLIAVAKVADVPEGASLCVAAAGNQIALFHVKGEYHAISDSCPHAGGPLSEGFVDDEGMVTCPWHGWCFGLAYSGDSSDGVTRYRVVVDGDDIKVEIP